MKTATPKRYAEAVVNEALGKPVDDREELLVLSGKTAAEFGLDAMAAEKQMQLNRIEALLVLLLSRTT